MAVVAAAGLMWLPITRSYFFADDFVWMLRFETEPLSSVLFTVFGGHVLIARNAIYWVAYQLFGFQPAPYAWLMLLTHLLNVGLFFRVTERLTADRRIAVFAGLAWGTSPVLVGTLSWYSVHGHALTGTTLLLLLLDVLKRRGVPDRSEWLRWWALSTCGALCFGVGVGLAAVFPIVLFLLRPAAWIDRGSRLRAGALGVSAPILYLTLRSIAAHLGLLPMSEVVILNQAFSGWRAPLEMLAQLTTVGVDAIVRGIWSPTAQPRGTPSPALFASAMALTLGAAWTGTPTQRRRLLACVLMCGAAYGAIALGRANLYSSQNMSITEMGRQLRYQYIGSMAVALVAAVALRSLTPRRPSLDRLLTLLPLVWLATSTVGHCRVGWTIDLHDRTRTYVEEKRRSIELALSQAAPGAEVRLENGMTSPRLLGSGLQPAEFPGLAALFVLLHDGSTVDGHRVLFVERNPQVLAAVQRFPGSRLAEVMVGE